MKKLLLIGLMLLAVGFSTGCARFVTAIPSFGSQLVFELTYRENVDMLNNRYFIVIGTNEAFQLPIRPYEFIEPTEIPLNPPNLPGNNYFSYYQTWQSYFVSDVSGSLYLINGPFVTTEGYTRLPMPNQSQNSKMITITCPLSLVYGSSIPDNIYFNVVSVKNRFLADSILSPTPYISKIKGSYLPGTDDSDPSIDGSLDLIGWQVRIE